MRPLSLVALLLATSALAAQQPVTRQPSIALAAPSSQGCPVGLDARHSPQGAVVNVKPSPTPRQQSYLLTFTANGDHPITQARITLHGITGAHALPAAGRTSGLSDATDTLQLAPVAGPDHRFHSTVSTHKLTGVQSIELNELTYADGSTWHESAQNTCTITPDGFLLVAGK